MKNDFLIFLTASIANVYDPYEEYLKNTSTISQISFITKLVDIHLYALKILDRINEEEEDSLSKYIIDVPPTLYSLLDIDSLKNEFNDLMEKYPLSASDWKEYEKRLLEKSLKMYESSEEELNSRLSRQTNPLFIRGVKDEILYSKSKMFGRCIRYFKYGEDFIICAPDGIGIKDTIYQDTIYEFKSTRARNKNLPIKQAKQQANLGAFFYERKNILTEVYDNERNTLIHSEEIKINETEAINLLDNYIKYKEGPKIQFIKGKGKRINIRFN